MTAVKNKFKQKTSTPTPKGEGKKTKKIKKSFFKAEWIEKTKAFLINERTTQIFGFVLLLTSIYLLIAFTSFLFTWQEDQDKLLGSWSTLLLSPDLIVDNWLGKLGAVLSHQFIHNWFGVSSFLFVLLSFILGVRILLKSNVLPLKPTFKYSLFSVFWLSLALNFVFPQSELLFLGGAFGFEINHVLFGLVGKSGTGLLIVFTLIVFLTISFNFSIKKLFNFDAATSFKEEENIEVIEPISQFNTNTIIPDVTPVEANSVKLAHEEAHQKETTIPEVDLEIEVIEKEDDGFESLDVSTQKTTKVAPEEDLELAVEEVEKEEILSKKEVNQAVKDFGEYDPTLDLASFQFPTIDLLNDYGDGAVKVDREELEANKNRIVETLSNYNIQIAKIKATVGPTVTLYEIVPAPGVRISKIKNLEDDIALSLSALGIRIIAPIPGKGTIGIEVPNKNPDVVSMRTVIASEKFMNSDMELPLAMGKTISNETYVVDLAKMPHLLMAGATGQGKSVGLNAVLVSLLYKKHPSQVKFVLVDPKKVELTLFNKIERHYLAKLPDTDEVIITDTKKVVNTLNSLCIEMDQRYELLKTAMVRNLKEYNAKFISRQLNPENGHRFLPYIVLVVDEFADLIMTAGKEVEAPIARLAQLARAIGIHLIIATQRPSVNIITGTIKANFPARMAFRVTSKIDSRTILDAGGADQLIGRGDLLINTGNEIIRVQCAFVDTPEVEKITNFIGNQRGYAEAYNLPEYIDESVEHDKDIDVGDRDKMFEEAAKIVVLHQQGSASLLQRKLKLGYNRAGRIIDQLEEAGIVGPFEGSKARQVLYPDEYSLEQFLSSESNTST